MGLYIAHYMLQTINELMGILIGLCTIFIMGFGLALDLGLGLELRSCHVFARHGMQLHQYADNSQVYTIIAVSCTTAAVQTFTASISDINTWMSASRLRLNPAKSQVMWLGSSQLVGQIGIIDLPVLSTQVCAVESARDVRVVIDSQLLLLAHVTALCRSAYYYLRQHRPAARSLSTDAAKSLVQAFISCRLDYSN